jgi:hypothetical protein
MGMAVRVASMRWLPLTGLAFVGCFALAVGLYGSGAGSDPTAVVAYYATSADRLRQIGGFAVLLTGCVFFLVYVVVLVRAASVSEPLSTVALFSGGSAALLLAIGNALWAGSAFTAEIERNYRVPASTHLLIEDAGFVVVLSSMAMAIPCVLVVSLATWHSRRLPRWFALFGIVTALALAAAYWYWPLAVFLVWIACGSFLLARSRHPLADSSRHRARS